MNYKYFYIFIPIICIYINSFFSIKDYNQKNKISTTCIHFWYSLPILLLLIDSWFINYKQTNYYIILTALLQVG